MRILLQDESFELLPEKALYHEAYESLVIADLHLGKASHFRKNGIAIPAESAKKDFVVLQKLIDKINPKEVIFLGDLFHSAHNSEWNLFVKTIGLFPDVAFILIKGNHDILHEKYYTEIGFTVINHEMQRGHIIYSHEPSEKVPDDKHNISGHIHPGFVLSGKAHDRLRLPCFYHLENNLILPAFGSLTGLKIMKDDPEATVYLVVKDKVMKL